MMKGIQVLGILMSAYLMAQTVVQYIEGEPMWSKRCASVIDATSCYRVYKTKMMRRILSKLREN